MRLPPLRLVAVLLGVFLVADVVAIVVHDGSHKKVKAAARVPVTTSSSTTSTAPAAKGPTTTNPVPADLAGQFDTIRDQVASLRGLVWLAPLDVRVANNADFVRQLNAVEQRDMRPDRMNGDGDTDKILQLIPNSIDYTKAINDLLGGE